jgi:hypothetical protein
MSIFPPLVPILKRKLAARNRFGERIHLERFKVLKPENRLEPPALPARAVAYLALHAPRSWSGQFLDYDDERITQPAQALFGQHLQ